MYIYLLRRLNLLVTTLFVISVFSFSLGHLFPGDPVVNFSGQQSLTFEEYDVLEKKLALDKPYMVQYFAYLERMIEGDFGFSFSSERHISDEFLRVFPATIELSVYAILVALCIGLPLGLLAGLKKNKVVDKVIFSLSTIANSVPIFWIGLLLILLFSLNLGWLPISGRLNLLYEIPAHTGFVFIDIALSDIDNKPAVYQNAFLHLILPTITLATLPTTLLIGMMRSSVISVMNSQFIKAARTKGLSYYQLIRRHVVKNAILPILPQFGLLFNTLMTSAMITEFIFSWPGVGYWLIEAIYQRDYPVIQTALLIVSAFMVFLNVLLDIIHSLLNPIVRKDIHG
ncbi:ABC transporter permease [Gayadomonas joobiniege]|uniref:ABC transporter permease n=1 Tax=Gayadomonas joobiniege TaxID=1234606 RepID=UPI0003681A82|nr:ABC transporter permease [Gayadomonas joobiniege]